MTFSLETSSKRLSPYTAENLVDLLKARAVEQAAKLAYVFLEDGEREGDRLSYADLDRRARAIAARLTSLGLRGERVLLLYPQGLPYIEAFFGCLYAGVVAVPAYPPSGRHIQRLQSIFRDATPSMVLTTAALRDRFETEARSQLSAIACSWVATDEIVDKEAGIWDGYTPARDQIAFLQYTSGSTGDPRGVMITHANLLSNEELIKKSFAHDDHCDLVGWLPLYHDMGLIGNVLQPLYIGATAYLMSPMAFLEKPSRWLKAISKYRAHTSGGPNFAYDLCVRKVDAEEKRGLDLSCWRIAFSGAEPVRALTLDRFSAAFSDVGFSRTSFFPCYGLAEATLVVTAPSQGEHVPVLSIDRQGFESAKVAPSSSDRSVDIVGCGHVWPGTHVEIVHPETFARCSENEVGEIWVRGSGVAKGYWQRREETAKTFEAAIRGEEGRHYLRTGDLGFFDHGKCYIAGRLKDLIIVAGRNFHPGDIECAIEAAIPEVRPGCSAAFSIKNHEDEETLVIVVEPSRAALKTLEKNGAEELFHRIRKCVVDAVDVEPTTIAFVAPGSIPKTSSGKIRRGQCRKSFVAVELKTLAQFDATRETVDSKSHGASSESVASPSAFLRQALAFLDPEQQQALICSFLISTVSQVVQAPDGVITQTTSFPDSGLTSLRTIEVKHRIDVALDIETPIGLLFSDETLVGASATLRKLTEDPSPAIPASRPSSITTALSSNQRAMWTVHQLEQRSNSYNLHLAFDLTGTLDVARLRVALSILLEQHEQLRTAYRASRDTVIRVVQSLDALPEWFCEVDATEWATDRLQDDLADRAAQPFDLERGPPLRVVCYRHSTTRSTLFFGAHHIAIDLWALLLFLKQLDDTYSALQRGQLPRPTFGSSYSDFVAEQARYLAGPSSCQDWDYWRPQLEGSLPILELPTEFPRPTLVGYEGASELLRLNEDLTQKLKDLAGREGART